MVTVRAVADGNGKAGVDYAAIDSVWFRYFGYLVCPHGFNVA
jgi:hypothetical protein